MRTEGVPLSEETALPEDHGNVQKHRQRDFGCLLRKACPALSLCPVNTGMVLGLNGEGYENHFEPP